MSGPIRLPARELTDLGFLLQGALNTTEVTSLLPKEAADYPQVLVLGHAGRQFWSRAAADISGESDPLDAFSRRAALAYLDSVGIQDRQVLFPADGVVDLRGLGRALGWHHDSPLGIGIHPIFGSWLAYRVVVAVPDVFAVTVPDETVSPCESCADRPCLAACPAGATGPVFDLDACGSYRLAQSNCSHQCLARNACPVGSAYRYNTAQMRYHYGHSLETLRLVHSRTSETGE